MTSVTYIHGTPPPLGAMTTEERRQRGRNVPKPRQIDYLQMTDGQLRLALLAEQLNILEKYAPENKSYKEARTLLENELWAGLHTSAGVGYTSGNDPVVLKVVDEIRRAKHSTAPAGGMLHRNDKIHVGGPLVPVLNCEQLYPLFPIPPGQNETNWSTWQNSRLTACKNENEWRKLLNDHLEKMAHHPLYEFIGNPNVTPTVAAKTLNHRLLMSSISTQSKISKANISLWQRNGVMRHNAMKGAGPLSPEESIEAVKLRAEGVGGFPIAAIPFIIAAIAAAAANARTFIDVVKGRTGVFEGFKQALGNTMNAIREAPWGPEAEDWMSGLPTGTGSGTTPPTWNPPGSGGGGFNLDQNTLLIGGGLAALLLLGGKK